MDHFLRVLARPSVAALSAGLVLAFSSHAALSTESCEQLEVLANQYASVSLTSEGKWWLGTRRIASAKRVAEAFSMLENVERK